MQDSFKRGNKGGGGSRSIIGASETGAPTPLRKDGGRCLTLQTLCREAERNGGESRK